MILEPSSALKGFGKAELAKQSRILVHLLVGLLRTGQQTHNWFLVALPITDVSVADVFCC